MKKENLNVAVLGHSGMGGMALVETIVKRTYSNRYFH
ncbi:hypothetical protein Bresa_03322|uniref:Uncharacterized protein n=1 Tax=Brenneria salicis ATCC 15712 = DSM 30166 TaxID=714314 RepID=A0A366I2P0_9GAMM|nr:hypothetical protein [Brenneria salicis ATCC 15712 = DSM 30166]RBP61924.1 hypothetical protein DES54_1192 [Brenneria salicis ATCC 15712 = DSM 30166]